MSIFLNGNLAKKWFHVGPVETDNKEIIWKWFTLGSATLKLNLKSGPKKLISF